jgi:hypothetical protein
MRGKFSKLSGWTGIYFDRLGYIFLYYGSAELSPTYLHTLNPQDPKEHHRHRRSPRSQVLPHLLAKNRRSKGNRGTSTEAMCIVAPDFESAW